MKKYTLLGCIVILTTTASTPPASTLDETRLFHAAHRALTDVMVADVFSPPVASRVYAYAHIAAYETLVACQNDQYISLAGQIRALSPIPYRPPADCQPGLAALEAFLLVGKGLIFSEDRFKERSEQLWKQVLKQGYSEKVVKTSKFFGAQVAQHILEWAKTDNYRQTRSLRRYVLTKKACAWAPTPPAYMAAVEPYWGRIRSFALDSVNTYRTKGPPAFSTLPESAFAEMAREVYETGKNLTADQRLIANYWDCNPFFLNTQGHLNFASKKLSPGGHWLAIAGQVARQKKASLITTSAAYTLTAIALFDGFISCWFEKYQHNLIRPETYINAHLDETWRPVLQTPPFPEYPSGHSVVSTASAVVLTEFFGHNVSFVDSTEMAYGLPARHFQSFHQAANEASISRLFGGIHYRPALENGQQLGEAVGKIVLRKIKLHRRASKP